MAQGPVEGSASAGPTSSDRIDRTALGVAPIRYGPPPHPAARRAPQLPRACSAGTHLLTLIQDILDLSEIEVDKLDAVADSSGGFDEAAALGVELEP